MDVPVAFFVFNRPDLAAQVFARIAEARPLRLLLIADGPRPEHPGDRARCEEVRRIVTRVDWPCRVETNFSEVNLGCGRRVASGLDWVFRLHEEAIILEDDCLPSPSFFDYCAELLQRYRNDERIGTISGCNLGAPHDATLADYCFSRYPVLFGWASWRRVWSNYDFAVAAFDEQVFGELFTDERIAALAAARVEAARQGRLDTWDYQLWYTLLTRSQLTIIPTLNLVRNLGFGRPDATHTTYDHPLANMPLAEVTLPLRHPRHIIPSRLADGVVEGFAKQLAAAQAMQGGRAVQ
jgi:hypothetical protein